MLGQEYFHLVIFVTNYTTCYQEMIFIIGLGLSGVCQHTMAAVSISGSLEVCVESILGYTLLLSCSLQRQRLSQYQIVLYIFLSVNHTSKDPQGACMYTQLMYYVHYHI